jgi:hypothetical protein
VLAVGFVGGVCVLLAALGAEDGRALPASVFGITTPVLLFGSLVILAISQRVRGKGRAWPWPS